MADHDVIADPAPQLPALNKPATHQGRPTVAALKASLTTKSATTFTADRLNTMTWNDLVYADRITP